MTNLNQLLENNRKWADGRRSAEADFFKKLSHLQNPEYLWIGCSDSRVPANEITGLLPGELFVHRNVANIVVHTDLNCLSVIQFAVDVLKVKHIIVCGHYGCGGVKAALDDVRCGLVDNWLRHIQDIIHKHHTQLDAAADTQKRLNRVCELNVIEQVLNVCQTTIVQDTWSRRQPLSVHGWIYDLNDGLLKDLGFSVTEPSKISQIYQNLLNPRS